MWKHFLLECLKPVFSSSTTPAIVVPPGDVTWFLSSAGNFPVSSTIAAEPNTVCAARFSATSRGSPLTCTLKITNKHHYPLTPASDIASINV